jgi:Tfp pilus assembly protein PilN
MNKFHGITAVSDGTYVQITAIKNQSGWKLAGKSRWQIGEESDHLVTSFESSCLSPCIHQSQLSLHNQLLEKNLNYCYPDDAYLCTIPLQLSKNLPPDSFIAIYKEEYVFRIGIIIERKLSAVFSLPTLLITQLSFFLERMRRYLIEKSSYKQFPTVVITFNNQDINPGDQFIRQTIQVPTTDIAEIKAFGIALCSLEQSVPSFCGPTKASLYRHVRTAIYAVSSIIVIIALLFTGYLFFDTYKCNKAVQECDSEYKNILNNNNDIRSLTSTGESLAKKLLRVEKFAAAPTQWNRFLELIGSIRPKTLYFNRLASEQRASNSKDVKIAITGWADSETTVTTFIQKLNKPEYVSNVSLSTLEQDKKLNNIKFKIICNITLLGN